MGQPSLNASATAYEKSVLNLLIVKLIQDHAFSDLTETAVCDVLIDLLKSYNYQKKRK